MKRFMIAVVVVGVLFNTGLTFAQDKNAPQMPEKVRKFLDNFVGRWEFEGSSKGTCRIYWDSSKATLVSNVKFERQGIPSRCLAMWYWDGISEDGIIGSWVFSNKKGFSQIRQQWKVLSEKVCEGPRTGVLYGKKLTARSRIEFTGSDRFAWSLTNLSVGGEMQPDTTDVFTRANTSSDEKVLVDLSDQWSKALLNQDAGNLDRILSDDFILINPDGVKTKNEIVDSLKSGDLVVTLCDYSDSTIRIYGDVAIIQGVGKENGRYKGENYSGSNRFTDVFLKRENKWQCIATHISKMGTTKDKSERNKAQVQRLYDEVVGKRDLSKAHEVLSPELTINGRELKAGPIKFYQNLFETIGKLFGDITVVQEHMVAEGNWVARRYRLKLDYYPGGRTDQNAFSVPVTINGMGFYEFDENGLIIQNFHIENENPKFAQIDTEHSKKKQQ